MSLGRLVLSCNHLIDTAIRRPWTMVQRKRFDDSTCPVARALDVIGDRWMLLIVRDALDGLRRFSEFQKSTGAARNILADRLRLLVEHDIFAVAPASDGTAYQEYVLTPKGEALFPLVVGLRQWGEAHLFARGEKHSVLIDKQTEQPLAPMLPMARDGHAIQAAETEVRKVASKARG